MIDIKNRILERMRFLQTCEHSFMHEEIDKRFGLLIVCNDCDEVIDRPNMKGTNNDT